MVIRQAAFEGNRKLLKGNLHCHTSRSDGKGKPEEVMRVYKLENFDFLAITDHRKYNLQNFLPDDDLLIIPGMEIDGWLSENTVGNHCFHNVVLGQAENNPYVQDKPFESVFIKDQFEYQKTIDEQLAADQMVILCHPEWSGTFAREFEQLKGITAMEIWNSMCAVNSGIDNNAACWDELLMQGKRVYGVASDDTHELNVIGLGWINVNAEKSVSSVLEAVSKGAFYSSCGPIIKDFYVENNSVHISCSECAEVVFKYGQYPMGRYTEKVGALTHAEQMLPSCVSYIRATVTDHYGRRAWTNPIFLKWNDDKKEFEKAE